MSSGTGAADTVSTSAGLGIGLILGVQSGGGSSGCNNVRLQFASLLSRSKRTDNQSVNCPSPAAGLPGAWCPCRAGAGLGTTGRCLRRPGGHWSSGPWPRAGPGTSVGSSSSVWKCFARNLFLLLHLLSCVPSTSSRRGQNYFKTSPCQTETFSCLCKRASVHHRATAGVEDLVLVP